MMKQQNQPHNPSPDAELLAAIYENASMAADAITNVLPRAQDGKQKLLMEKQLQGYQAAVNEAGKQLKGLSAPVKENRLSKLGAKTGILLNTLTDSSPSKLAELMIQGTDMGVVDLTRALNKCPQASQGVKSEAEKLLKQEQNYIDDMKQFL